SSPASIRLTPGVDTLYVADDGAGIQKYSLVGGNWTLNGTAGAATNAPRGLIGSVSGTTVSLFATTGGSTATRGGTLYGLVDPGGSTAPFSSPTLPTLATAGATTAFRGVAFAPVPEPASVLGVCGAGFAAAAWLRRRRAGRTATPTA